MVAATSTVCVTSPTCNWASVRARSPATRVTLVTDFLKAGASTVTVYWPGGNRLTTKSPDPVVCVVRASEVAVLTTVTLGVRAQPRPRSRLLYLRYRL